MRSHGAGRRRRDPRRRRATRCRGRRRRGHGEHEDGGLADRAGRRPRARGARRAPTSQVTAGRPLVADRAARRTRPPPPRRARGAASRPTRAPTAHERLDAGRSLGYDVARRRSAPLADALLAAPPDRAREHAAARDLRRRARAQPPAPRARRRGPAPAARRSTCTRSCARSTPRPRACPTRFVALLERALAHFGISGLERTARARGRRLPAVPLPAARAAAARDAVRALLRAGSERGASADGDAAARRARPPRGRARRAASRRWPSWRASCAGAAATAPRGRGRARADLRRDARSTWRRCRRTRAARTASAHLQALVDCPQPLARLLDASGRRRLPARGDDAALLPDPPARGRRASGWSTASPFVLAAYEHDGRRHHVAADASPSPTRLPAALRALAAHARDAARGRAAARRPLRARAAPADVDGRSWPTPSCRRAVDAASRCRRARRRARSTASTCDLRPRRRTASSPRTATCAGCTR